MSHDYAFVTKRGTDRGRGRGRGNYGNRGGRGRGSYSSNRGSNRGRYNRGRDYSNGDRFDSKSTVRWNNTGDNNESPDLRRLLADMGKSITVLSERLDNMQNNRGIDKRPDGKVDRPTPINTARPPIARSSNDDFASVSKSMYRLVQLRHHEANWNTLPTSINSRLKRLADDIKPPAADEGFKTAIADLTTQFGEKIRHLVVQHLHTKIVETEIAAGLLHRGDIDRAKEVATKYISTRLGKRLPESRRIALLQQAMDSIGIHFQQPLTSPPGRQQPDQDGWRVAGCSNRQPNGQQTAITDSTRKQKRHAPSPDAVEVSNRFQQLNDCETIETVEIEGNNNLVHDTSPSHKRLKKIRRTTHTRITTTGVHVHGGNKYDWLIEPKDETKTIVIGDSNLKSISTIPEDWEIHSLPGAHLNHVVGAVARLDTILQPVNVVIHVGINHRTNVDSMMNDNLTDLMNEVELNSAVARIFFAGTSTAKTLPDHEARNVHIFNEKLKDFIGEANYIPPIDTDDVDTDEYDYYGIHYTTKTADLIIRNIENHVNQSVFH